MARAREVEACRFCLTTDVTRYYYPLLDIEDMPLLQDSLALVTNLNDSSIKPKFFCEDCDNIIKRFLKLKKEALDNEKLLMKYQKEIVQSGLRKVLEQSKLDGIETYENSLRTEMNQNFDSNPCSDDEELVKKETYDLKEENIDYGENKNDIKPSKWEIDQEINFGTIGETNSEAESCSVCGRLCRTKKILRSHMLVHTSKIVKCPKCIPEKFLKENGLKKHLKNCHKVADVPCEFPGCEKKFKLREVMQRHIKSVHMLERTLCSRCGAAVLNLSYHLETCNKDNLKNVICKTCNKQFASKMSLSIHEKSIHGPTALEVCTVCGKAVKDIKSHMKLNHTDKNQRTISCDVEGCDGMFRTKQEIRNHINRVHLDLKTQCTICLQWLKNLPEHISQVHQQEKKHVCSQCGKPFFKSSDLKAHIERIHQGKKYICPECGKSVSKIREHMKSVHRISDVDHYSLTIITANGV